mmetsp:Transcript_9491/g.43204  ORF Transcript_9491/g.43204 Transcript_9491/m.43204 type:complete len:367 (+) Transcript_9491:1192-2292(+)
MPFRRIFLRELYRPARISMFPRFFFRRDPRILPFASGLRDSYAFCSEISLERTNAANSSNVILPSPDWSPSSTKSCTKAFGILRECAKLLRSSWLMYPFPNESMRVNSSRRRFSRSCHGLPLPRRWHVAFIRCLSSSHCSCGTGPLSGPHTTNQFSTNPSVPAFMMAFMTQIPMELKAPPMSAMRFWRSHVIRFTLVNPVSGSSNTVTTVSPMMPCCESGSPGAGSVAVPSLLDGVPTPLMVMDANAPRVDRHLPLRRNAPLRPLRGCFPVADPSSSRSPASPWAVRPRKNLLVTPPWFLASQADAIADAARRAASMGAMLPKTRGKSRRSPVPPKIALQFTTHAACPRVDTVRKVRSDLTHRRAL